MTEDKNTLRIIALNTWKGDGAYSKRLEVMARELTPISHDFFDKYHIILKLFAMCVSSQKQGVFSTIKKVTLSGERILPHLFRCRAIAVAYYGFLPGRLAAVANFTREKSGLSLLRPDLLCLQEVLQSGDKTLDTAKFLSKALNLQTVFAPARWKQREIEGIMYDCYSGLAILSVHPILDHRIDRMLGVAEDPERIALTARVRVKEKDSTVLLTNLHLTHVKEADNARLQQLQIITVL